MRRHATIAIALALVITALVGSAQVGAVPSDTRGDRDRVRAEQAKVAGNLDVLKASRSEVEAALQALQANVDAEEGRLDDARRAVTEAQSQITQAEQGIKATAAKLDSLKAAIATVAVDAYIEPGNSALASVLGSDSATEALQRRALRSVKSSRDADLTEQARALRSGLESHRREAAAAKRRAKAKEAEVTSRVKKVQGARTQQQKVVDGVQQRIDGQIERSVELAGQDKQLSYKLALEQAALQARIAAARIAASQKAAAAAAAAAAASPAYSDGGREGNGPVAGPGSVQPAGGSGGIKLCTVGGITVSCQISSRLQSLLSAAAADGVSLSGGGYRDPSAQISLRQQHCGSSNYAIYQMSASACRPPTARPGQSQHELGLAIDFSNCGRGSSCYSWLKGNASSYGFYNLPSESWHWSINGN